MTTDLRDLLELASDDVPEVDLSTLAWEAAETQRRTARRRAVLGAGVAAAAAAVATVVVREDDDGGRAAGLPRPSPTRLRTAEVGGVTVSLAPEPGEETGLPRYAGAAALALPPRIGFTDLSDLGGFAADAAASSGDASVRAVLLAWSPGARGLVPVLYRPRAGAGLEYLECGDVELVRADPTQTGQGMVLHPRTVRDDRLAVVLPQPEQVVVVDARTGGATRIPVPDPTIHLTGWAKDNRTVVAWGAEATWLVDTATTTSTRARVPAGAGWVDLVTVDGVTELRTFSAAGLSTGSRSLRGPVIDIGGEPVGNPGGWAAAHASLGQTYVGAIGRSQGLIAVQGDLRPTPRVLAAPRSPAVPKGCYRPLVWGPQDVVVLESRSFAGLTSRPTLRLLAWDVIGGGLSYVGEVGPVTASEGGLTGAYAL